MVVVAGDADNPLVLTRNRVEMADPRLPGSKQPYHEVEKLPLDKAEERLARLRASAGLMAHEARAASKLRKTPAQLAAMVRALGQPLGAPWGADQKSAALLAWLLLAGN